jgi:hypothetical protein
VNNPFRYSRPRRIGFSFGSALKGEGRLECQQASIIEFRAIWGTSSAKVTEWVSLQSLKRTMEYTFSAGLRAGIQRFRIYLCVIPVEAYTRGVGAGRTFFKQTPHSLDREDHQDFVNCCRTYSNSKSSDRVVIDRFDPSSLTELTIQ